MCGIIGYTGCENAIPKITNGLAVLEYRGYDSAGLAAETADGTVVIKCRGRVADLCAKVEAEAPAMYADCAIGHTRWATHGGVTDANAHPHTHGRVTLVHNGILENEKEWREKFLADGVVFHSETDTEVAAVLIDRLYAEGSDPVGALYRATDLLRGSYAFAVLFSDRPGELYAIRHDSPLLLCEGKDGTYLASDLTALLPYSRAYYCLEEGVVARLTKENARLVARDGTERAPAYETTDIERTAAERGGYETFMEKEIHEQPQALRAAMCGRVTDGLPDFSGEGLTEEFLRQVRRIHMVACGSAMHAGMLGAAFIEEQAGIPTEVFIASEYRYHMPPTEAGTLVIVISQSGETADTLAAERLAREKGLSVAAIVNAPNSSIAREADCVLYTHAGPEIAVATTKGYCTQAMVLLLLSLALARAGKKMTDEAVRAATADLTDNVPAAVSAVIAQSDALRDYAREFHGADRLFYIGRGRDRALAMEGSLKLKEISYLHSEAYAAGELKHGTISLIEEGTPVIAISTEAALSEKMTGNVREVACRGAEVLVLCREKEAAVFPQSARIYALPAESDAAASFAALLAMQIIAYEVAKARGCDIDRPRNLAKSVTVE